MKCGKYLVALAVVGALGVSASTASALLPTFSSYGHLAFTLQAGALTLRTPESALLCSSSSGTGEITGAKTGVATLTFSGCRRTETAHCTSPGAPTGEIVTNSLPFSLVYYTKTPVKRVAIDFNSTRGTMSTFFCSGHEAVIRNSILAPVSPLNTSVKEMTVAFEVGGAEFPFQEPRENYTENLLAKEASFPEMKWLNNPFSIEMGLKATETMKNFVLAGKGTELTIEA
jgi:hypothetical protein